MSGTAQLLTAQLLTDALASDVAAQARWGRSIVLLLIALVVVIGIAAWSNRALSSGLAVWGAGDDGTSRGTSRDGYAIELIDIVKRFPGVVANDGVNLKVRPGTIHAIVGENGAGKSTLMKTLYGAHRPDEGTVLVEGEVQDFRSPAEAIKLGIGMVFQHFMLADNFTVWENIVLGREPGVIGVGARAARRRIRALATEYGLEIDPDALVADLGVGAKQRVEILKVLYRGAHLIILDEPTAVLVPHEVDDLFRSLRQLTDSGSTIVFISHHLDEVLEYADAITVIRAGKTVGEIEDPAQVTAQQLAEMMVGSELPSPEIRDSTVTGDVRLAVTDLTVGAHTAESGSQRDAGATEAPGPVSSAVTRKALDGVSIDIHAGEIVGIAGVEGNGQAELVAAILGLVPATGTIMLDGADITRLSTARRREAGIGFIAEDRQRDGMVLSMPIWENAILGHQGAPEFTQWGMLNRNAARARGEQAVRDFDVRTPSIDVKAFTLSGGNQQKLIVGREMLAQPKVLVAAHPTRGVDVGAQALIWDVLRDARSNGLAMLLVSADLEELIGLSDRLLVMLRGKIVADLDPATVTPSDLGTYMTGANQHNGVPSTQQETQ